MSKLMLLALVAAGAVLCLLTLVIGAICAVRRQKRPALICLGVLIACMVATGAAGIALAVKTAVAVKQDYEETNQRIVQGRKEQQQRIDALKAMHDPAVLPTIPAEFFTDSGFRDYWRLPLIYPYHIVVIDSLNEPASLQRKDGTDGTHVFSHITHLCFDGRWLLLKCCEPVAHPYVLFEFQTGRSEQFDSESALLKAARQKGYAGDGKLEKVSKAFDLYYGAD